MDVPELLGGFICEKVQVLSNKSHHIYRVNLQKEADALKFFDAYKHATNTQWNEYSELKSPHKVVYHHKWCCHHSKKNKGRGKTERKLNLQCEATFDILIKKINKSTKRNDPEYLKREIPLQAVITISAHNHAIDNCEALRSLKTFDDVKEEFRGYFELGMGPAEAMRFHESKLMVQEDAAERIANGAINPKQREIIALHDKWRKSLYGSAFPEDSLQIIKSKIAQYSDEGTEIRISENTGPWALLVVTPIMKRAQLLSQAQDVIFVDSSSSMDSTQATVTVVLTTTGAGAVPISILIHENQSTEAYINAFLLLKTCYPNCFGNSEAPHCFMTDHSYMEREALRYVWPTAARLLCHFHIAQAEWRWLLNSDHGVKKEDRQCYIAAFQKIMYSKETADLEHAIKDFNEKVDNAKYKQRLEKLLEIKEDWVLLFRTDRFTRGHNTNNYSEACIRILKDIMLNRTKAFNVAALVDFVAHVLDDYFVGRILHFAYQRQTSPRLQYNALRSKVPEGLADKIQRVGEGAYLVPSVQNDAVTYEVLSNVGWCSCPVGRVGAFCKHQTLVHDTYGGGFPNCPSITPAQRYELEKLAIGEEKCHSKEWHYGFRDKPTHDTEEENQLNQPLDDKMEIDTSSLNTESELPIMDADSINTEMIEDEVLDELRRVMLLAKGSGNNELYRKTMKRLLLGTKRVRNGSQAMSSLINIMGVASKTVRKCGQINVQPTSISRRRKGLSRGSKRMPAGRPPHQGPSNKRAKKQKHNIADSIRKNVASAISHGTGH